MVFIKQKNISIKNPPKKKGYFLSPIYRDTKNNITR